MSELLEPIDQTAPAVATSPTIEGRSVPERLTAIEVQLKYLSQRIDEVVITQLKDHGKRIATLESRQTWAIGWIAGAIAFGAALEWILGRIG